MLRLAWQGVRKYIHDEVVDAGYELTPAVVGLFRTGGLDGWRPGELAEDMLISKQAVNDLLRDVEDRGYIIREADPADGRARIIRLTNEGRKLEAVVLRAAHEAERRLERALGRQRVRDLRGTLQETMRVFDAT